jgi:stearoyl-CoA desaturase (Delta-9 desaturase)
LRSARCSTPSGSGSISAGFHRYFSHRTYKTTRAFQFLLAWIATSATQKGPLWWAANHRHHHAHSDTATDAHSPRHGFWWSHVGWFLSGRYAATDFRLIPDLAGYPELRFLNDYHVIPPIVLAASVGALGAWLQHAAPELHTSAFQMVVWGYFVSTVLGYHSTFMVNSLAHVIGRRRFPTRDDSRNSLLIALVTFGEGWHNNHHFAPSSERQGFLWWEIDVTHYVLTVFSWIGLVWDLNRPPKGVYQADVSLDKETASVP